MDNVTAKAMPSSADIPLLKVQHLLASPAGFAGPTLYLVLSSTIALALWHLLFARPHASKNAPKAWNVYDWPVVGSALSFYSRRRDMAFEGFAASQHGNFSFYIGKKHVVALSGPEGRKTFYENRVLNLSAGFVELLAGMPFTQQVDASGDDWTRYFNKILVAMLRSEALENKLPLLRSDMRAACDRLTAQSPSSSVPEWRVLDAFDTINHLLFRLLSRIVGATEVSEDVQLSRKMLSIFETFESSNSTTGIIFPWLRVLTPSYILRMILGTVLYINFNRIIKERKRTGRREDDALQYLLDQDTKLEVIIKFQISAVWAALLTTGAHGTWLLVLLASNPTWHVRCRAELDHVVSKHRTSSAQSPSDILDTLTLEDWESSFLVLEACLRETMRVAMPGAVFRRNLSGGDVAIGNTGEVVPNGSYVSFLVDEVHMNPEYYPDPERFDPERFLEGGKGKKEAHTYVAWGSGKHLCLGARLAKLEITLIVAYFMARFDFELSDKKGNVSNEMPQLPERNEHTVKKSKAPVYLRYKPRV